MNVAPRHLEGDLEFDFSGAVDVIKLDEQGAERPVGMSLVDFVVEESDRVLLMEVKDPSCPNTPARQTTEWSKYLKGEPLIREKLTPKARDSYTFLHLMNRDKKPFDFIFILGAEKLNLEKGLLSNFRDRLLRRLRRETGSPWVKKYIRNCVVLTICDWKKVFPEYSLRRVSESPEGSP